MSPSNHEEWEQAVFDRVARSVIHNSSPVFDENAYKRQMIVNAEDDAKAADGLFDLIDEHAK